LTRFGLSGRILAHHGQGDALAEVLLEAARLLEGDEQCELYVVSRSPDDPEAVWVTEVWADEAAHAASLERDDVRALIGRGRPLIAGFGDQVRLRPLGGKGLT